MPCSVEHFPQRCRASQRGLRAFPKDRGSQRACRRRAGVERKLHRTVARKFTALREMLLYNADYFDTVQADTPRAIKLGVSWGKKQGSA
jgi:hypothetical protein